MFSGEIVLFIIIIAGVTITVVSMAGLVCFGVRKICGKKKMEENDFKSNGPPKTLIVIPKAPEVYMSNTIITPDPPVRGVGRTPTMSPQIFYEDNRFPTDMYTYDDDIHDEYCISADV